MQSFNAGHKLQSLPDMMVKCNLKCCPSTGSRHIRRLEATKQMAMFICDHTSL